MATYFPRRAAPFWMGKELPKHILYLYKDDFGSKWQEYTIYDLIKEKVKKQERNLFNKRKSNRIVSCYIHLHKVTMNGSWHISIRAINFRSYVYDKMKFSIIQKHNCGIFPEFYEEWANTFYKKYKRKGTNNYPLRAVKFTQCELDPYNNIVEVF